MRLTPFELLLSARQQHQDRDITGHAVMRAPTDRQVHSSAVRPREHAKGDVGGMLGIAPGA